MIENVLAWGCLGIFVLTGNPQYLIAAGAFAIAAQIYYTSKGGDN